ncbi:hypothetical protein D2912_24905 [Klebsiella pneumoniae]|nr:hypothetical protein [Klebsiella pneumoniae]MBX4579565.1 hypothetical protein [Klebsiella pneumoniae]
MTSLKTSIKTITYLSDIGCLEIQGASLMSIVQFPSNPTLKPIFVNWAIPPNVISDAGAGHGKNGAVTSSVCPAKNAGILQQRTLSTTIFVKAKFRCPGRAKLKCLLCAKSGSY